jgi:predicted amidohydrolase
VRVAAVQHDIAWEDPDANFERLVPPWIAAAAAAGARLVVLTEMYSHRASRCAPSVTAEPRGGPTSTSSSSSRRRARRVALRVGPELARGQRPAVQHLVLAAPDGSVHRYRKIHPFTYADEHEHFDAGADFVTVDVEGVRVSLFVCYDLRFADEFWATWRATPISTWCRPTGLPRRAHWRPARARAIENQAYVAGATGSVRAGELTTPVTAGSSTRSARSSRHAAGASPCSWPRSTRRSSAKRARAFPSCQTAASGAAVERPRPLGPFGTCHRLPPTAPLGQLREVTVMEVRDWMALDPVTVRPSTRLAEASRLLREFRIRHLPVVARGQVVGMLSDRDLIGRRDDDEVETAMSTPVVTVDSHASLDEAARLLISHRINGLPVMDGEELVGIITTTDVLDDLTSR